MQGQYEQQQPQQYIPEFTEYKKMGSTIALLNPNRGSMMLCFDKYNVICTQVTPTLQLGKSAIQMMLANGSAVVTVAAIIPDSIVDDVVSDIYSRQQDVFHECHTCHPVSVVEDPELGTLILQERPDDDRTDDSGYDRTSPRRD